MPDKPPTAPRAPLTVHQYNQAVDLWNAGNNIGQIAAALGVGIYDLHPIARAATRVAMRVTQEEFVVLEKINTAMPDKPPTAAPIVSDEDEAS